MKPPLVMHSPSSLSVRETCRASGPAQSPAELAITDELTGLYNGRYFRHFLSRIIERGRAMRFPVTLLLFDIDDFKKYNDKFGHGVGDEILSQTATLMRRCCRDHDLVARIGGDEFAVVFWEKEGPRSHAIRKPPAEDHRKHRCRSSSAQTADVGRRVHRPRLDRPRHAGNQRRSGRIPL